MKVLQAWGKVLSRRCCRIRTIIPLSLISFIVLCVYLWIVLSNTYSSLPLYLNPTVNIFSIMAIWGNLSNPFLDKSWPIIPPASLCLTSPEPIYCSSAAIWREPLVECQSRQLNYSPNWWEKNGNNIMFTLRTTRKFHRNRLPQLFQTWLTTVNRSNVFVVSDERDEVLEYRIKEAGMHYVKSVPGYSRLCQKAGDEISLMFKPQNIHYEWFCHVDDDIYVNLQSLVTALAKFSRKETIYFGRSGSDWRKPLNKPRGSKYHFAVGGMYCLNRLMLNEAKNWIGNGISFRNSCLKIKQPEDVTIGFIIYNILHKQLQRTRQIYTHGLDLYGTVNPDLLAHQIAFSYGTGSSVYKIRQYNVIFVPNHLFHIEEDPSQFLSLHCHLHPIVGWCMHRKNKLIFLASKNHHNKLITAFKNDILLEYRY